MQKYIVIDDLLVSSLKEQRISDVSVWSQTRTITQTRDHKPAPNGQKQGIKV
jgi:hypothetical protein